MQRLASVAVFSCRARYHCSFFSVVVSMVVVASFEMVFRIRSFVRSFVVCVHEERKGMSSPSAPLLFVHDVEPRGERSG